MWLTACGNADKPQDLVVPEKMVYILSDIHVIESQVNDMHLGNADSSLLVYQRMKYKALKKYEVDSVALNRSLQYYIANPGLLKDIYTEVKKVLEDKKKKMAATPKSPYSRPKPDSAIKVDSAHLP
jgi:hypothetical protein